MIDGDFAFVLWDSNEKKLILVRDGMGVKSLFYALVNNKLFFASEMKSLLVAGVKKEVDLESFYKYINYFGMPESATLIKEVKKLLPGHIMIYSESGIEAKKYWDISFNPKIELPEEQIITKLLKILKESVRKRFEKSHKYGLSISGGLDSSSILALIRDVYDGKIDTYTADCDRPNNEFEDAKGVANFFNTDHHEILIDSMDINLLPKALWHADLANSTPLIFIFHHLLSNYSQDKKVLFFGHGADALFCTSLFTTVNRTEPIRIIPYSIRKKMSYFSKMLPKQLLPFIFSRNEEIFPHSIWKFFTENEKKGIFQYSYKGPSVSINGLERFNYRLFRDYEITNFYIAENECAANSQEGVSLFADKTLVDFVCKIPFKIRLKGDKSKKYLLKRCMERKLPNGVLMRKKIIPVHVYLLKEWANTHKDIFYHFLSKLSERNYFKKYAIMKLFRNINRNCAELWQLWNFELWHEIFIDKEKIKPPKSLKEFL